MTKLELKFFTCRFFYFGFEDDAAERGSSLLEVMIACGIMGILMLGIASQITFSARSTNALEKDLAFIDLVQQLERVAANATICTGAMVGTTPATGGPVNINFAGLALAPGSSYQNGILKISKLEWALVTPLSASSALGYLTVQADLSAGTQATVVGGNVRNFPKPGSTPPGILIDLRLSPLSGKIVSCGGATSGIVYDWAFSSNCWWGGGNLQSCGSTAILPAPGMPDNTYTINCTATSIANTSGKVPTGAVTIATVRPTDFDYVATTLMSNGQHNNQDHIGVMCHAYHP